MGSWWIGLDKPGAPWRRPIGRRQVTRFQTPVGTRSPAEEIAAIIGHLPGQASLIFGAHDYRRLLHEAARAAGIDAYRAERISDYDFRHSRLTHFGRVTDNLAGVMYLAGHTQPATTARYMRPLKDAAEDVLRAVAAAGKPEFRSHSGHTDTRDTHTAKRAARTENTGSNGDDSGFQVVRGGGIEPPWLLTASTSSEAERLNTEDSTGVERQDTPESALKRPIPVTCDRNSGAGDRVAEQLAAVLDQWRRHRDHRQLRRALLGLLQNLDSE